MHIWLTIPNLLKTGGGPANVVQHLSEHLASLGASVSVLTLEAGSGQTEALPRDTQVNIVHIPVNHRTGCQSIFDGQLRMAIEKSLVSENNTLVHDFGLWLPANHAVASVCRRHRIPMVCSPCGMLASWALNHKRWKKRLAWWLYQRRDLFSAALLAATSRQEIMDIRRLLPGRNIALVPNGVDSPKLENPIAEAGESNSNGGSQRRRTGPKTAVFLGRIHPVKGLRNLVEAWDRVKPAGWRFIVAGPDEAEHQMELESLIRQRNLKDVFNFPGMMEDDQKWALLREADLFVLPSFTENFGVVVGEALACGVPVLTTKGTPWKELVDHHCGWWVDVGVEPLVKALREATALSDQERRQFGERARRLVQDQYSWSLIAKKMWSVYQWLLGNGAKPICVYQDES